MENDQNIHKTRLALRRVIASQIEIIRALTAVQFRNKETETAIQNLNNAVNEISKALNILNNDESN